MLLVQAGGHRSSEQLEILLKREHQRFKVLRLARGLPSETQNTGECPKHGLSLCSVPTPAS